MQLTSKKSWKLGCQSVVTPEMNSTCCKRRAERAGKLIQHFSIHSLPQLVFQGEKHFSLKVPSNRQNNRVYFNGPKEDVEPERLYSEGNKSLKKVMVSAVMITWKGVSQPFFIGGNGIKVNRASNLIGLQNRLIATLSITTFRTMFKRKYTMVAIAILLQWLMS